MLGVGLASCMQDSDYNPMYMVPIRATRAARRAQLVTGEPTLTLIRRFMVQLSQKDKSTTATNDHIEIWRMACRRIV